MPELGHLEAAHGDRDGDKPRFGDAGVGSQVHCEQQRIPRPPAPPAARRPRPRPCAPRPIVVRSGPLGPAPCFAPTARAPPAPPPRPIAAGSPAAEAGTGWQRGRRREWGGHVRALTAPGPAARAWGLGAAAAILCAGICPPGLSRGRGAAPSRGRSEVRMNSLHFREGNSVQVAQMVNGSGGTGAQVGLKSLPMGSTLQPLHPTHPA